jgi:hypothetical protein
MAMYNQKTPIGGHLDPWGDPTTSAIEALTGAVGSIGSVMSVGEQLAERITADTKDLVRKMWFTATGQAWFLVAGDFRNAHAQQQPKDPERTAAPPTVVTLGDHISFAATGNEVGKNWQIQRLAEVRARIAAVRGAKKRQEGQLATRQRVQAGTYYAQEAQVVIQEAEKIQTSPTGKRMDNSPYYLAIARATIAEARRKQAQKDKPVVAKGRTTKGLGNIASRQHADKAAGFAGATGE